MGMFTFWKSNTEAKNENNKEIKIVNNNEAQASSSLTSYLWQGVSWAGSMLNFGGVPISLRGSSSQARSALFKIISLSLVTQSYANDIFNMLDPNSTAAYQYMINSTELEKYDGGKADVNDFIEVINKCGGILVQLISSGALTLLNTASVENVYDKFDNNVWIEDAAEFYRINDATIQYINTTLTEFFNGTVGNSEFEECMINGMNDVGQFPPVNWALFGIVMGSIIGGAITLGTLACLGCKISAIWQERQMRKELGEGLNPKDSKGYGSLEAFNAATYHETAKVMDPENQFLQSPTLCC